MGGGDGGTPPTPPTPPQGPGSQYPQVPLGQILEVLPEMVQDQILQILNSGGDDTAMTNELKALLNRFAADLETVNTDPNYLAYMLVYYVLPQLRQQ